MSTAIIDRLVNLPNCKVEEVVVQKGREDLKGRVDLLIARDVPFHVCSNCGQLCYERYDRHVHAIRDLGIIEFNTYLVLEKWRVACPDCGVRVESLGFARPHARYTRRFEDLVAKLCEILPVSQVAELLGLDWKTVKEIDKRALEKRFAQPDYTGLRLLAIDEISYEKRHKYLTNVLDLERGGVVWVGEGRRQATLQAFFDEIGPEVTKGIEAIAIDMWDPYIRVIRKRAPKADIVYDKYHVIQSYGRDVVDKVRNAEYRKATGEGKEVLKGTKYLLLTNRARHPLSEEDASRLKQLRELNENINTVYILKEDLAQLWACENRDEAEVQLDAWIQAATESGLDPLLSFAETLQVHRKGLLAYHDHHITSGQLEGFNNKIKVVKRRSYGFHDLDYFMLKIKQACPGKPP